MKKLYLLFAFPSLSGVLIAQDNTHKVLPSEEYKIVSSETEVFYNVDVLAEYLGGASEMMKFIHQNLTWPVGLDACVEGRVVLRFTVEKTGDISNIRVIRSLHELLDKEALRVVKLMPKWTPAKLNGEEVACYYTLPVMFKTLP